MINQVNARWWYALNGGSRQLLASPFAKWGWFPLVNEYPKSGASWLAQMLAASLDLRFPRNRLPHFGDCLLHGHLRPKGVGTDVVLMHRDGRDVMVSYYFHRIVGNEYSEKSAHSEMRALLKIDDPLDIRTNLPRFIEANAKRQLHPGYSWGDFAEMWAGHPNVKATTTYEELQANAARALKRCTEALGKECSIERAQSIADSFSFAKQAKRQPGQEDTRSYLRKGVVGDWANQFTKEAGETFYHYFADVMAQLGYAENSQWLDGLPDS